MNDQMYTMHAPCNWLISFDLANWWLSFKQPAYGKNVQVSW